MYLFNYLFIHFNCAHSIKCKQAHNKIITKILKILRQEKKQQSKQMKYFYVHTFTITQSKTFMQLGN